MLSHAELTKNECSLKVGVSGVPWLYMDILLCRAAVLLAAPDDDVVSSTSKGLQDNRLHMCTAVHIPYHQQPAGSANTLEPGGKESGMGDYTKSQPRQHTLQHHLSPSSGCVCFLINTGDINT